MPVLTENARTDLIDAGLANKWRWDWLEEMDENGLPFRKWLQKLDTPGQCLCSICCKVIKYDSNGKKNLHNHSKSKQHKKALQARGSSATLEVSSTCASAALEIQGKLTMKDRIAHQKALLLAFSAEHNLPFSIVPELLDLCTALAEDKKALLKTSLSRTSATYTSTHGLAAAFREELRSKLRDRFFSVNVDEATNNAMDKVLNIVVQYFDDETEEMKVEHFASSIVNIATAANLTKALTDSFKEDPLHGDKNNKDIPLTNMVSCLMDNCATMRGKKGGVETLLRNLNPSLLDISGDSVHIVSNAAKVMFKPFSGYVENVCSDLYYDLEKSPKAKELFIEIQSLIEIEFHRKNARNALHVLRPCPSRFLQMLAVTDRLVKLMDAVHIYYFAFLEPSEQKRYRSTIQDILSKQGVSSAASARITEIQTSQAKQAKSSCNETSKDRLLTALFKDFKRFSFQVNLYRGLLVKLESYVKALQAEKPLMHTQHERMFSLVRRFLTFFMKREHIPDYSVKRLKALTSKLRDPALQVSDRNLCVGNHCFGEHAKALADPKTKSWMKDVCTKLRSGLQSAAEMLLTKLPLDNKNITRLSCLAPAAHGEETTRISFNALAKNLQNVIAEKELGPLDQEARDYVDDRHVTRLVSSFSEDDRIDSGFWKHVFNLKDNGVTRYPLLSRLVKALLSIFSGPLVESSFNMMDDCIRGDRSCLTVENYEGVAVIRSALKAKKLTAAKLKCSPAVLTSIRTANKRAEECLKEKQDGKRAEQALKIRSAVNEKARQLLRVARVRKASSFTSAPTTKTVSSARPPPSHCSTSSVGAPTTKTVSSARPPPSHCSISSVGAPTTKTVSSARPPPSHCSTSSVGAPTTKTVSSARPPPSRCSTSSVGAPTTKTVSSARPPPSRCSTSSVGAPTTKTVSSARPPPSHCSTSSVGAPTTKTVSSARPPPSHCSTSSDGASTKNTLKRKAQGTIDIRSFFKEPRLEN